MEEGKEEIVTLVDFGLLALAIQSKERYSSIGEEEGRAEGGKI